MLRSKFIQYDPLQIVLADEAFLQEPDDLETVKNIYQIYIRNIAAHLEAIDPAYRLISPTPDILNNDARLEEFIRENFAHNHHQQGSLAWHHLERAALSIGGGTCMV